MFPELLLCARHVVDAGDTTVANITTDSMVIKSLRRKMRQGRKDGDTEYRMEAWYFI